VKAYELYLRSVGLLATNNEQDLSVGLAMLDTALSLDPNFANAHAHRGYALWRKYFSGWDAEFETLWSALGSVEQALDLDPSCTAAKMTLIRICWDFGWHERAVIEGTEAFSDNPGSLEATLALARSYNNAGLADLALPLTQRVLAIDKGNPTALKLLTWNYLMVREYSKVCEIGSTYLPRQPLDSNTPWAVAMAHLYLGHVEAAIHLAKQGLHADRSNFTLWVLLGYIHREGGDEPSAQACWLEGIDTVKARLASFPQNLRVRAWLANLQAGTGQRTRALETMQAVRAAAPTNGYLLYRLAQACAELEELDMALELLKASIATGFLSVQLMRCEEICGFKRLVRLSSYQAISIDLERKVDLLRNRLRSFFDQY
jgi:tetratricopeptide (TPR) repeat protein